MLTSVAISVFAVVAVLSCLTIFFTRQLIIAIDKYKAENGDWLDIDDRSYRSRQ